MLEDENDQDSLWLMCELDEGSLVNQANSWDEENFGCDEEAAKE
eukprot:CAMPEP_0197253574 /NCGR_PEP_ID=MMETSP1429-20130617/65636_1 /TAXON_ID=49237 /ORGANISM="Chaetoceros  sp., Strain UNC1202" /LENGTH=43 /DNA_ID= /DNA_START= /DNA_END= /DNA_ORIENTATION=